MIKDIVEKAKGMNGR